MAFEQNMISAQFDNEAQIKLLQFMQSDVEYSVHGLSNQTLLAAAAKKIPWLSRFLLKANNAAFAAIQVGERTSIINPSPVTASLSQGFYITGIGIDAMDLIIFPAILLAGYLANEKVTFSLDNKIRWAYAGVAFSLTLTSLLVPGAAVIISFVTAGAALGMGLFMLARTVGERIQLGREKRQNKREILRESDEMERIQGEAKLLETKWAEVFANHQALCAEKSRLMLNKNDDPIALEKQIKLIEGYILSEQNHLTAIYLETDGLQERYNAQKKIIGDLFSNEFQIEQKIKRVDIANVLDRAITVGLSVLTIAGLVLSLLLPPPLGPAILVTVAVIGATYTLGRLAYSGVMWIKNKFFPKAEKKGQDLEDKLQNDLTPTHEISESTASIVLGLADKQEAIVALEQAKVKSVEPPPIPFKPADQDHTPFVTNEEKPINQNSHTRAK